MNRRTLLYGLAGTVAAAALLAWAFAPRPIGVELAQASRGPFETTIDEDGRTRLRERYVVSAPLAGHVSRITLREGDPVAAGAVVATLAPLLAPMQDDRTLRAQQARVEAAEDAVRRAGSRIERTQIAVDLARNDAQRTEQLAQRGFVAPTRLEADRLAVRAAEKELEASAQDRLIAIHDLEQARAALAVIRQGGTGRSFAVRAPAGGRVLRVAQPSEGAVALGAPLLEIGDTAQLEIVAELLTTDALRTRPGAPVLIERWGGPVTLEGRVRRIEPAAFTKVSALGVEEQRVNVLIDIASAPEAWRSLGDGFRVGVRIVLLSVPDALRVPASAVFPLPRPRDAAPPDPSMAVFGVVDGRARRIPVAVGGRNGTDAWIRAGLQEGDAVIVYPPASVADGARVTARPR
jgi:HlyD family secretion protein